MSQNFLHGVETILLSSGARPVREVKTAVIGLIGIAPSGPKNVLTLVKNDVDAAQFGVGKPGFDIPQALSFIFGHNAGTVLVINVFDEDLHTTAVVAESHTVTAGKLKLSFAPIGDVDVLDSEGEASDYVKGTDYLLDEYGYFSVIAGRIPNTTVLKFSYSKLNAGAVTNNHIIGTVDGSGNRTGIKAFDLSFTTFGFRPKILIAPGRSATKTIADELLASAERLKAIVLVDSTLGDTVTQAISARGDASKSFGTSAKRIVACYPYLKGFDKSKDDGGADTDTNTNYPYSMFYAGLIAKTDNELGYWFSPSNKNFSGVTGVERNISANLSDPQTDSNALNEAGIVTVFNSYGTGYRSWGNRNASFPTNTETDNFISLLRTFDVVHESLEQAALEFVDLPITQSLIDDILHSGNSFVAVLVGRGALTPGSRVVFNRADNSNIQLAAGQLVFTIVKDGPSPAERITYLSVIDISLKTGAIN